MSSNCCFSFTSTGQCLPASRRCLSRSDGAAAPVACVGLTRRPALFVSTSSGRRSSAGWSWSPPRSGQGRQRARLSLFWSWARCSSFVPRGTQRHFAGARSIEETAGLRFDVDGVTHPDPFDGAHVESHREHVRMVTAPRIVRRLDGFWLAIQESQFAPAAKLMVASAMKIGDTGIHQ